MAPPLEDESKPPLGQGGVFKKYFRVPGGTSAGGKKRADRWK